MDRDREPEVDSQEPEVDSQETTTTTATEVDSQEEMGKRMRNVQDDEEEEEEEEQAAAAAAVAVAAEDALDQDEIGRNSEESWTSDGNDPYIFWHVNSHGSMNDTKKTHKHGKKETDMGVRAFSIAGNQNQCGWATILNTDIPVRVTEPYECSGKAIDFCIPSVERLVWSAYKKRGDGVVDVIGAYNAAIQKVKNLYFHTETYTRIQENGGFTPLKI